MASPVNCAESNHPYLDHINTAIKIYQNTLYTKENLKKRNTQPLFFEGMSALLAIQGLRKNLNNMSPENLNNIENEPSIGPILKEIINKEVFNYKEARNFITQITVFKRNHDNALSNSNLETRVVDLTNINYHTVRSFK